MMEYLLKVNTIVDNLVAIKESISEQDQILYLLEALDIDHNSFVVSMISRHETLSVEEIHSMLFTHEHCLE